MQVMDQQTAGSIASGAYLRKMAELGLPVDMTKINKEAMEYAQLIVRRTQSTGHFKDVPLAITTGRLTGNRSLDRAIFQFQNFLLNRWSRIRHDAIRVGINTKDPRQAVNVLTGIILASIAASGVRAGVNKVSDLITGKDDGKDLGEEFTKGIGYELSGSVPFLGTMLSMAMYDAEMFPILDAPKDVVLGLSKLIGSESESAKLKAITQIMEGTGKLAGVPGTYQATSLAKSALYKNKKRPKTGLVPLPSLKGSMPSVKLPKL